MRPLPGSTNKLQATRTVGKEKPGHLIGELRYQSDISHPKEKDSPEKNKIKIPISSREVNIFVSGVFLRLI